MNDKIVTRNRAAVRREAASMGRRRTRGDTAAALAASASSFALMPGIGDDDGQAHHGSSKRLGSKRPRSAVQTLSEEEDSEEEFEMVDFDEETNEVIKKGDSRANVSRGRGRSLDSHGIITNETTLKVRVGDKIYFSGKEIEEEINRKRKTHDRISYYEGNDLPHDPHFSSNAEEEDDDEQLSASRIIRTRRSRRTPVHRFIRGHVYQDDDEDDDHDALNGEQQPGGNAEGDDDEEALSTRRIQGSSQRKGKLKRGDGENNPQRGGKYKYCSSDDSSDNGSLGMDCRPRILKRGQYLRDLIEFSVEPIRHLFVCPLCNGFFREPFTVTKQCLHTFCKSCLVLAIASQDTEELRNGGGYCCPSCNDYLGSDWRKHVMPDRSLERLMDKTLFVDMAEADEDDELAFYESRGIKKKPNNADAQENDNDAKRRLAPMCSLKGNSVKTRNACQTQTTKDANPNSSSVASPDAQRTAAKTEQICLVPAKDNTSPSNASSNVKPQSRPPTTTGTPVIVDDPSAPPPPPPPLEKPFLEVPGNIRIGVLKKYLSMKVPSPSLLIGEIYCNGSALGNEWTIGFIKRTIWISPDESSVMTLEYR